MRTTPETQRAMHTHAEGMIVTITELVPETLAYTTAEELHDYYAKEFALNFMTPVMDCPF